MTKNDGLINDFIQILRHDSVPKRRNVVYIRHLVRPWSMFEAGADCLYDAKLAVEEGERFHVHVFVTENTNTFLVDLLRVQ
jgi:hypothetical protein